jgi:hypothetical protein
MTDAQRLTITPAGSEMVHATDTDEVYIGNGSTVGGILITGANTDASAIHDDTASEISAINNKGTPVNADMLVIEDSADGNAKKMITLGTLPAAGGGEANTGSDLGGTVNTFKQKTGVDLEFRGLTAGTGLEVTENATDIDIGFDTDTTDMFELMNASCLDSPAVTITESGGTVYANIEKSGTGDIRVVFSDGVYDWDCTPIAQVALTAGSDISPTMNYVYVLQSSKVLTASTAWPATEHAPVATVLVQSAASVATDGPYKMHAWTDHVACGNSQGHLAHLNYWIRQQNATWQSGCALTPTAGAGQLDVAVSAGIVLQLHTHTQPAFNTATGSDIYIVNDPTTAYDKVGDLTGLVLDADGNTMGGSSSDFYNLVIWGVVNEVTGDCKLMCNLPSGSYDNDNGDKATNDDDGTAIYTIPSDFTGVGFLIARLTVSVSGGTYTVENNDDLRGSYPGTAAGGGATGGNEFADNVFRIQDDGDVTKEIAFQASGITTANTRTITMPDADVTLITATNATDLTDAGDSTLHYHAADRARAVHTGQQLANTISNFDTEVANNSTVNANSSKLSGIETGADVTDATNVAAAGAVMKQKFAKGISINVPTATDSHRMFAVPFACTITRIEHQCASGTVTWNLEERAGATPFVAGVDVYASDEVSSSANSIDVSFANAGLAQYSILRFCASAISGPGELSVTVYFEEA